MPYVPTLLTHHSFPSEATWNRQSFLRTFTLRWALVTSALSSTYLVPGSGHSQPPGPSRGQGHPEREVPLRSCRMQPMKSLYPIQHRRSRRPFHRLVPDGVIGPAHRAIVDGADLVPFVDARLGGQDKGPQFHSAMLGEGAPLPCPWGPPPGMCHG